MNPGDVRRDFSSLLALIGAVLAGSSFIINYILDGAFDPDDVSRTDAVLSVTFMFGTTLILVSLLTARTSPVGHIGRGIVFGAVLMALGALAWSIWHSFDPNADENVLLAVGDACAPLHQLLMFGVGGFAAKHRSWPEVQRRLLFAPGVSVILAVGAMGAGLGLLGALLLGSGWLALGLAIAGGTLPKPRPSPSVAQPA